MLIMLPVKIFGIAMKIIKAITGKNAAAQKSTITKEQLKEMFANTEATTNWDMAGSMLWGYFFFSPNRSELEKISAELVDQGYRLVELREPDISEPSSDWLLHVERIEPHTIDTLSARNSLLTDLANHHQDVVYDGMDVGPVE